MSMIRWCGTDDALQRHRAVIKRRSELEAEVAKATHREQFLMNLRGSTAKRCELTFKGWDDELPPGYSSEKDPFDPGFRKGWSIMDVTPSGVAKIHVQGCLVPTFNIWQCVWPEDETSYEAINDALKLVEQNEDIISAVMVFDSGGGYACGMDECAANIRATSQVKQVSGYTGSYAFSAAYGLMSATSPAYAYQAAEVGSIGTYMVHMSYVRMLEESGIDPTVIRAGEFKALGLPQEELTDEAKALMESKIQEANGFFLRTVANNRGVSLSEQSKWGEGKTFFAQEAQNLGLLDRVGTFKDLFDRQVVSYYVSHNQGEKFSMHISQEKLERIGAGESPAAVLTPAELKAYNASITDAQEGKKAEGEPVTETTEETKGDEGKEGEEEDKEPTEPEGNPTTVATSQFDTAMLDKLMSLTSEVATLKAENAQLTSKVALAEAGTTEAKAVVEKVMPLAKQAVTSLQRILGKPVDTSMSAQSLVDAYSELRTEQLQRFPTSQRTLAAEDKTAPIVSADALLRQRRLESLTSQED